MKYQREKIYEADRLHIGESGTISDYETPIDFNNKILYNNNIKEEKVKEEVESNLFLEGVQFKSSFENLS